MKADTIQEIQSRMKSLQKSDVSNVGDLDIVVRLAQEYESDILPDRPQLPDTGEWFYYLTQAISDLQKLMQTVQQDVNNIKMDMRDLRSQLDDKWYGGFGESEEIVEMSIDDIKKLILDRLDEDKPFYPSDIAMDHNLDYDAVTKAVNMLRREGHIQE